MGHDWLIYNPNIFGEASFNVEGVLKLAVVDLIFKFSVIGFKFTPFDYTLSIDMARKVREVGNGRINPDGSPATEEFTRYCQSMSYFREVFDITLHFETNTNECSIGLLGGLV